MRCELKDSLKFIYADSVVAKAPCRSMNIDTARGGTASVHILLTDLIKGRTLRVNLRANGRPVNSGKWFCLVHVPVEVNTGPVGFIEKKGEHNQFTARRAPFRVYDAIAPCGHLIKISSSTMALRLEIPVARDARTGRREYTLAIQCGKEFHTLSLAVNIHKPVIPSVGPESFPYTNWFSFNLMAERHGLKQWTEEHWRMIRRYADMMGHGRQNTFLCPLRDIFRISGKKPVLDRNRLKRIVKTFTNAGMYYIEGGHVATRTDGEWNASSFDIRLTGERATSVQGNKTLAHICRQLMEEIERNKWQERWLQHVCDEPTQRNATDYRLLSGMVRRHMP